MSEEYLATVRQLLRYHPETGNFYWLVSRGRQAAGSVAGTNKEGYITIKVMEQYQRANRLAWLFMTGEWPPKGMYVDHKNRQPADNRWTNLRLATDAENSANQSVRPDNTSGYPGVGFFKRTGRWFAYIHYTKPGCPKSTKVHLGYFATKAEAIAARKAAETQYFGAFAPQHEAHSA